MREVEIGDANYSRTRAMARASGLRHTQVGGPRTDPPMHDLVAFRSGVELDDAANNLAGFHVGKALVDLRKLDAVRNPIIEMQLALLIELNQPRHVHAESVGAHRGALDFALAQEVEAVSLDFLPERYHADDGGRAAGCQHIESLLGRCFGPQAFDRVVHSTLHQILDLLDGVAVPGIDDVGGPQLGGELRA